MSLKEIKTIGVIGAGAFGEFMVPHLAAHFEVMITDPNRDCASLAETLHVSAGTLEEVCARDAVIFAAPLNVLEDVLTEIAPKLTKDQLFIEVCSVKCKPVELLKKYLPEGMEAVALHPLFGPQSGRNGIAGLNIAVCDVFGEDRALCVKDFLHDKLKLHAFMTTPEQHDYEMSYVMGITHMMGKVFSMMDVPETQQQTRTFQLLNEMVRMIKNDSDELFRTIQRDNPFVEATKEKFFASVKALEERLRDDKTSKKG
ncbi:MAG: prephenate dehydrogenase/arogenate dehydrogenase family protein [Pseudobdellovibrionaceae bacterium]